MIYRLGDKIRVTNISNVYNSGALPEPERMGLQICANEELVREFIRTRIQGKVVNIGKDSRGNIRHLVLLDNGQALITGEAGMDMIKPSYIINADQNKRNLRLGARVKTTVYTNSVKPDTEGYIACIQGQSLIVRFEGRTDLNDCGISNKRDCAVYDIESVVISEQALPFANLEPQFSLMPGDILVSTTSNLSDAVTGNAITGDELKFSGLFIDDMRMRIVAVDSQGQEVKVNFYDVQLKRPERPDSFYSLLVGNTMEIGKRLKCTITGSTHEYIGIQNVITDNDDFIEGTDSTGWYIKYMKRPYRKPRGEREYIRYIAVHPDKVTQFRASVAEFETLNAQYTDKNCKYNVYKNFAYYYDLKESNINSIKRKIERYCRIYADNELARQREEQRLAERREQEEALRALEAEGIWCHHLRR